MQSRVDIVDLSIGICRTATATGLRRWSGMPKGTHLEAANGPPDGRKHGSGNEDRPTVWEWWS